MEGCRIGHMGHTSESRMASVSVVALIQNDRKTIESPLIMVRQMGSRLWGPVAGGIDDVDASLEDAVLRELREEGNILPNEVVLRQLANTRLFPDQHKKRVGIVYEGYLLSPLPLEGRTTVSTETDWIKPWRIEDLADFLTGERTDLYRPEFNMALLNWWARDKWPVFRELDGISFASWLGK